MDMHPLILPFCKSPLSKASCKTSHLTVTSLQLQQIQADLKLKSHGKAESPVSNSTACATLSPEGPQARHKLPHTLRIRSTLPAADRRKRGSWLVAQRLQNECKSCLVRDLFVWMESRSFFSVNLQRSCISTCFIRKSTHWQTHFVWDTHEQQRFCQLRDVFVYVGICKY